jgi:hypothetical protein
MLKNRKAGVTCRLIFRTEPIYVATSQFEGRQHDRRKAQRFETFRTRRAAQEARPMEGRQQGCRSAENETGRISGTLNSDQ